MVVTTGNSAPWARTAASTRPSRAPAPTVMRPLLAAAAGSPISHRRLSSITIPPRMGMDCPKLEVPAPSMVMGVSCR